MKTNNYIPRSKRFTPGLLATLAALGATSYGQLSIANTSSSYVIDFDQSVAGVNNGPWAGIGFDPGASVTGLLDSNAWASTGWAAGALTFGGTQTANEYARGVSPGTVTTAGIYAFSGTTITTGVALGFQPTAAAWTPGTITLRVKNDTSSLITGFSFSYKLWVNNNADRSNSFNFLTSADDTSYSAELAADYTSTAATDAAGFTLVTRTLALSNLNFTAGGFHYLRWAGDDVGGAGSRDEFALDDISLSAFTTGVAARNVLWSPITGAWDTTAPNWTELGLPVTFQPNDNVTFDETGLTQSTVTIQAAGVTIGSAKVTNTSGTYTFLGGSLSGSGSLTKTGTGKLVLSSANAYTGATVVTEGTVSISADDQLGAATAPLIIGAAGTLETTGSLTLNAGRSITGTGTISIAPSTTLNIAGAANTGVITLSNTGSLLLSGAASAQFAGLSIQQPAIIGATLPILLNGPLTTSNVDGTVAITGALSLGGALRVFTITEGSAPVDASVTGNLTSSSASGRLHKLGDGTLSLLGDNSGLLGGVQLGTAGSTPLNGGTLIVNSSTSLGPGGVGTAGQFRFNAGTLTASAPIQFPATLSASVGNSAPLATIFAGSDVEFLGFVSFFYTGTVPRPTHIIVANSNVRFSKLYNPTTPASSLTSGLTIQGTGSLTLVDGGEFSGSVSVDGGELYVTGNLKGAVQGDNRPAITVANGGVLGGSVSGSASLGNAVATEATISPGTFTDPTGILTFSTLDYAPAPAPTALQILNTGTLLIQIGGTPDTEYDQVSVFGTVELAGTLNLSITNGFVPVFGDFFTLILNDDVEPVSGTFLDKLENSTFMAGGYEFRINYAAGDGNDVIATAVPEPGSIALLLGGLGFLGLSRRRGHQKPV